MAPFISSESSITAAFKLSHFRVSVDQIQPLGKHANTSAFDSDSLPTISSTVHPANQDVIDNEHL